MEQEQWKEICGYEGLYWISSFGAVKSKRKTLSICEIKNGYSVVSLCNSGKQKTVYVHHLVAEHFISKRPQGLTINHMDKIKKNNSMDNLEYVSTRENCSHGSAREKTGVFKEIRRHKKKNGETSEYIYYQPRAFIDGKRYYVGNFKCKDKAHKAYKDFLSKIGIKNKYA